MNPIPELAPHLKQLRLSGILDSLEARNRQAIDARLAYTEFLALLIQDEVARREQKKFTLPAASHRIWRQYGLQVPRKRPRKCVAASRPRPLPASDANQVWAYDFVYDACANGQQLKCLTVIDEYTRERLAIDVCGSIRSARDIDLLSRLVSTHGAPRYLRSDNGPEFVSRAVLRWLTQANIDTAHIDPGKPWQNGSNGIVQRQVQRRVPEPAVVQEQS